MAARSTDVPVVGNVVSELWWLALMESILAIFFGIAAIFWPSLTLITLDYLFSAFVLVWGIIEIVNALMSIGRRDTWWLTMIFGLVGLVIGVYLVRNPGVAFATFILLVGATLIVRGLFDIIGTFLDRRSATHRILLLIIGIVAVIAGIIVVMQPAAGGVAFVWIIGLYALIFGVVNLAVALEARREMLD